MELYISNHPELGNPDPKKTNIECFILYVVVNV